MRILLVLWAACSDSAPSSSAPDLALACRPSSLAFAASTTVTFPSMSGPAYLAAADFDGDGRLDFAVSNYKVSTVSILRGNGDGSFDAPKNIVVSTLPRDLQGLGAGDFTGDGVVNLVAVSTGSSVVTVLRGDGKGGFSTLTNPHTTGPMPEGLIAADFNRDGKLDVALALGDGSLDLLRGDGKGGFSALDAVATPLAAVGDFNGDGILDVAGGAFSTLDMATARTASIVLGKGDGSFTLPGAGYTVGSGPDGMATGDFDGDRRLDLVVTSFYDDRATLLLGNGDGTFTLGETLTAGSQPDGLAVGDLDCDGHLDIVVANSGDNGVSLFHGNGDGSFASALTVAAGVGPGATLIGDFNGDGRADVLCTNYEGETVTLLTQLP